VQPRRTKLVSEGEPIYSPGEFGTSFFTILDGEVTLKRIYREGERVRLQPANSMMSPIYASARDVAVQGVVVGLMRRF